MRGRWLAAGWILIAVLAGLAGCKKSTPPANWCPQVGGFVIRGHWELGVRVAP